MDGYERHKNLAPKVFLVNLVAVACLLALAKAAMAFAAQFACEVAFAAARECGCGLARRGRQH